MNKQDQIWARIKSVKARRAVKAERLADRMPGNDKQKIETMEQIIEILRQRLRDNGLSDDMR
jgi:hypothetical protein